MDDSQFDRTPNPFSAFAEEKGESRGQLVATSKFLTISIGMFLLVTAGQVYWNRAKITSWGESFASQTHEEKLERLRLLSQSGEPGIAMLVESLVDRQPEVSSTAAELLFEMQTRWELLPSDQADTLRGTLARELVGISKKIGDVNNPQSQRVRAIADRAAKDWIASGQTQHAKAYQDLILVIARPNQIHHRQPLQTVAQHDQSQRETTPLADSQSTTLLPLDLAGDAGTAWTDWPPTASTPSLYRPHVESLASMETQDVVLQQPVGVQIASGGKAELLRPRPHASSDHGISGGTLSDWVTQLRSRSRYVRMQAVTALAKKGDALSRGVLETHVSQETDQEIATRIRQHLNQGTEHAGN